MGEEVEVNVAKAVVEAKGVCVGGGKGMTPGSSAGGSPRRDIRRLLVVVIARWSWWYYHRRTLGEKDATGGVGGKERA